MVKRTTFRLPSRRSVTGAIGSLGAVLTLVAIVWWGLVFYQVANATGVPMNETASCLFHTSDLCSLAMSLCLDDHILGIKRYSSELLWIGVAIFSGGVLSSAFSGEASRQRTS